MDIAEIRKETLRRIVEKHGGISKFVKTCAKENPDQKEIDPSYISQILNGHRVFREKAARNMEKMAGLPELYFDTEISKEEMRPKALDKTENIAREEKSTYDILGIDASKLTVDQIEFIKIGMKIPAKNIKQAKKTASSFIDNNSSKKGQKQKSN